MRPEMSTSPSFTWPSASTTRMRSRLSMTLTSGQRELDLEDLVGAIHPRGLRVGEVIVAVRSDAALVGAADAIVADQRPELAVRPQREDTVLGERREVQRSTGVG